MSESIHPDQERLHEVSFNSQTFFLHLSVSTVMNQQLLILEMFIITLVTRLLYRRQYDPLPEEEEQPNEHTKMVTVPMSV